MTDENKKDYEIAFLLPSADSAKELGAFFAQHQAEIFHQSLLTEIRLSYPIKKHTSAQFGFYHFRTSPEAIQTLKEDLLLNQNLLRFMIVTPPVKLPAAASSQQRQGQDRKPVAPVMSNEMLEGKLEEMLK